MPRRAALFAVFACLFVALQARADDRATARKLGDAGLELYDRGDWAGAYDKLAEAHRLVAAPTLLLFMARSKRNLGELLSARDLYREIVTTELAADAPPQFRAAKASAETELGALEPRIPSIVVELRGEAASVTVDGNPLDDPSAPLPLDPGEHRVEARASDGSVAAETVALAEGAGVVRVHLELPGAPAEVQPSEGIGGGFLAGAATAFAFGALGLGVGIATGVMAKSRADEIKSRCTADFHCLESDAELGDEAETLATVSTVGFVLGGVGVAAGVVLLVVPSAAESSAAVRLGPGVVSLSAAF